MRVRVEVPATSANMGSGFDSIGIALSLRNVVHMEQWDCLDITCLTGHKVATDERNLIYTCAKKVFDRAGKPLAGLRVTEECNIPMTRGLGSSSACTVAGLLGANALLGQPLSMEELIDMAASIEGHPDNSTPAIRGGFVAALLEDGHVWQVRVPIAGRLHFCVLVPDFELKTEAMRAVLPDKVPRRDAIFNLSRAALLAGSLVAGDLHNIGVATDDRLHQPYRLDFIPQGRELMDAAMEMGALGVYISGAGPTIIAIAKDGSFLAGAENRLSREFPRWKPLMLQCDEVGATVTVVG